MSDSNTIDFLLIGKTGNGKSSTGNSILLRDDSFASSGSASSVTSTIKEEFSEYKGRIIKVVDSPGIGDTRCDTQDARKMVTTALKKAMFINSRGYHAFLIVIKYGCRFTGEEQGTIKFLKSFFGENFVKDFCIIVMTNGDSFKRDNRKSGKTFETWCSEQTGEIKELLDECEKRIVLFDNYLDDTFNKEQQVDKLLDVVDKLKAGGKRYVDSNFEEAKETRKRAKIESQHCIINEKTKQETSLIFQKLEQIQELKNGDKKMKELLQLKERCSKLLDETKLKDKGTNVLQDIISAITSQKKIVTKEIENIQKEERDREELAKRNEENRKKEEEDRERLRMELEKLSMEERLKCEQEMKQKLEEKLEKKKKKMKKKEAKNKEKAEKEREQLQLEKEEAQRLYKEATEKSQEGLISKAINWISNWFKKK
ncbi:uncharacterized protein LOC129923261 [Biomphalaria glabrata]|uniref:Uncharacterized protein LOC129923261 n=1 Tax=Biomphalaria glabrata TaxID=6526 RepID=A0A9W2Z3F6_BIOGL|nr:uncharacterized protein LOC129923261 [Biomphalaria glabrata]